MKLDFERIQTALEDGGSTRGIGYTTAILSNAAMTYFFAGDWKPENRNVLLVFLNREIARRNFTRFLEVCEAYSIEDMITVKDSRQRVVFNNGYTVHFATPQNIEAFRGIRFSNFYLDNSIEMISKSLFTVLMQTTLGT